MFVIVRNFISVKICSKCHTQKDDSLFSKNKGQKDGLQSWCKECFSKKFKEWAIKNAKEYYNEYRHNPQSREIVLMHDRKYNKTRCKLKESNRKKIQYANNKDKMLSNCVEYAHMQRETLGVPYIKKLLRQIGFNNSDINSNPELITIQKAIIQIKRYGKEHKKN